MPALLFDLDGTLLDSDAIHEAVFRDIWTERGLDVPPGFYTKHVHGRLNTDIFAEFLPDEPDPQALSDAKEAEFRKRLPRPFPAMAGAENFLSHACEMNWPMAVVTNAMRLNADAMLEAIGLRSYFDVFIIGEECERGKPDPEPYESAMAALGVSPSGCIAFEDSPSGMRAANAAGAYCIGVRSSLDDAALRACGAHQTIENFNDPALGEYLKRFEGANA